MNEYPEIKCPKCGGIIEVEVYDSFDNEDYFINYCCGYCTECDSSYQWKEVFEVKFSGIEDFKENT